MAVSVISFKQIKSLDELENSCLSFPLRENEWGILALDLDQMLVQGMPTLGNEHFYRFMQEQNRLRGLKADAHYSWTVQVRERIAYETCEPIGKVNQVISRFMSEGWVVKILTSRGFDMKKCTHLHLEGTKLVLKVEDVIFKGRDIHGKLMAKDESLIQWMKEQPQWEQAESIRIKFADDVIRYCSEVQRVPDQIKHASVECFHYTGALPDPNLTNDQLEQLIVQLYAYSKGLEIPYQHVQSDVDHAMLALGITEVNAAQVYEAIGKVADLQGYGF